MVSVFRLASLKAENNCATSTLLILTAGSLVSANSSGTMAFKGRPIAFSMAATNSLGVPPGKSRLNRVSAGSGTDSLLARLMIFWSRSLNVDPPGVVAEGRTGAGAGVGGRGGCVGTPGVGVGWPKAGLRTKPVRQRTVQTVLFISSRSFQFVSSSRDTPATAKSLTGTGCLPVMLPPGRTSSAPQQPWCCPGVAMAIPLLRPNGCCAPGCLMSGQSRHLHKPYSR
jgi:hypothetical protein